MPPARSAGDQAPRTAAGPPGRSPWSARRGRAAPGRRSTPSATSSRRRWPPESARVRVRRFSSRPTHAMTSSGSRGVGVEAGEVAHQLGDRQLGVVGAGLQHDADPGPPGAVRRRPGPGRAPRPRRRRGGGSPRASRPWSSCRRRWVRAGRAPRRVVRRGRCRRRPPSRRTAWSGPASGRPRRAERVSLSSCAPLWPPRAVRRHHRRMERRVHRPVDSEVRQVNGARRRRAGRGCRASSCGITLVLPTTVMKLASPPHRGTTCWCRWSASDPPATPPRLSPTLNPCGEDAFLMATTACRVSSASAERLRVGEVLELGDVPVGHHHQVTGVVGVLVQDGVDLVAARDDEPVAGRRDSGSGRTGSRRARVSPPRP